MSVGRENFFIAKNRDSESAQHTRSGRLLPQQLDRADIVR
jgi:hypothetical protein